MVHYDIFGDDGDVVGRVANDEGMLALLIPVPGSEGTTNVLSIGLDSHTSARLLATRITSPRRFNAVLSFFCHLMSSFSILGQDNINMSIDGDTALARTLTLAMETGSKRL